MEGIKISEIYDIAAKEIYEIDDCYINNKGTKTRVDRFIYKNGNVLSKVYQNNHLRMVSITKA